MSDTNRTTLAYGTETNFAVTPGGPPTLQNFNFTSDSLEQATTTVDSQIVRSDGQIVDTPRTGISGVGELGFELQFGGPDDFWQSGLRSAAFTVPVTVASGVSYVVSLPGGVNTITAGAGTPFSVFAVGQWVKFTGWTNAGNNTVVKILTIGGLGANMTLAGPAMIVETSTGVTSKQLGMIQNGTTLRTHFIERAYLDLTNEFAVYNGYGVNTLKLGGGPNTVMTGSIGFSGKKETSGAATVGTGTNTAAPTTGVMNTVDSVLAFLEAGIALPVVKFETNVNNSIRQRPQVATLGASSLGLGTFKANGTFSAYYGGQTSTGKALIDKYLGYTSTAVAQIFKDSAGNVYVWDIGAVKLSKGKRASGGVNQDVIADMAFNAIYNPADGQTLRIFRG